MKAIEFLKSSMAWPSMPCSREGTRLGKPSSAEMRRWLKKGSVLINGKRPKSGDEVTFPIRQLIYFSGDSRVTVLDMDWSSPDGH